MIFTLLQTWDQFAKIYMYTVAIKKGKDDLFSVCMIFFLQVHDFSFLFFAFFGFLLCPPPPPNITLLMAWPSCHTQQISCFVYGIILSFVGKWVMFFICFKLSAVSFRIIIFLCCSILHDLNLLTLTNYLVIANWLSPDILSNFTW